MSSSLFIDYACRTEAGAKPENADAAGVMQPAGETLRNKGVVAAIADGMSSSEGGREAAEVCISGFINDYLSTPDSWTVKTSASKVLGAINRWLYAQGQKRYASARGMVTTFTGLVIKSATAHLFHVGDSRLYLFRDGDLELLTRDHRIWVAKDRDFLSRAMGVDVHLDIDYRALAVEPGDLFLFATDGVSSHLTDNRLRELLLGQGDNLQGGANAIVEEALRQGSSDNVTCQLLKVLDLPTSTEDDILQQIHELPFPPPLSPGNRIDGYEILRALHVSSRSEVYLARDTASGERVILKTPSVNFQDDPNHLEGFLHEEWVGRRIHNPHVARLLETPRRRFLYNISEYIEGQTLRQWIDDHPQTPLHTAREYLTQIAEGLRAFHRLEMVHLDLKPDNVLIDRDGILKLIDFGSTRVAGTREISSAVADDRVQGTLDYTAPECVEGEYSNRSDIFSLGVIGYELLTGHLPYGHSDRPRPAHKLRYIPARERNGEIPPWVDGALRKAVHTNPQKRYDALSEFLYDLSHPNAELSGETNRSLVERNPLAFWKGLSVLLLVANLVLLYLLSSVP